MPTDSRTSAGRHLQRRVGHRTVGHDGRDLDERLNAAEGLGQGEDARALGEAARPLFRRAAVARLLGRS